MTETELKDYNKSTLYLLPLLDPNFYASDFIKASGFVNTFTEDIDRPWLESHTFLLFETVLNPTIESLEIDQKLQSSEYFYGLKHMKIKGKHYKLYAFVNNSSIKALQTKKHTDKVAYDITSFWGRHTPLDVVRTLYNPLCSYIKVKDVVPEEDYSDCVWEQ